MQDIRLDPLPPREPISLTGHQKWQMIVQAKPIEFEIIGTWLSL